MRLFNRQWRLTVGSLDLSDLDIDFKVTRSVRREPNKAEIQVWNLSPDTRARVEEGGQIGLNAGYEDPPLLFRGDSRWVYSAKANDGRDIVTTIVARDGGRAYVDAEISRSYAPGTQVVDVARDVVDAMGIGAGNLADFAFSLASRGAGGGAGVGVFADGYVAHGRASRILNDLIRASGNRWSVQNGSLQIQRQGQPLQLRSTVLAADTGLLGLPTWDERGNRTGGRRGLLTAECLIQPGIEPGRQVRLEGSGASGGVSGDFEVRAIEYAGSTYGNDWKAKLTLRRPTA